MLSTGISKNPCICLIERDRGTQRVRDTVSYIIGGEGGEVGEQKMGNGVGAESVLCTGGRKEGRERRTCMWCKSRVRIWVAPATFNISAISFEVIVPRFFCLLCFE